MRRHARPPWRDWPHFVKGQYEPVPLCRGAAAAGALPHIGPAPPETASPWMRLYLYHVAGYGPPTLLLTKGTQLRAVPRLLLGFSRLLVVWWGAEAALETSAGTSGALPAAAALAAANSALRRGPVMLQAIGVRQPAALKHVMFPPDGDNSADSVLWGRHAGLRRLARRLRLARSAGYVTLADVGVPDLGCAHPPPAVQLALPRKRKETCGTAKPISEVSLSSSECGDMSKEEFMRTSNVRLQSPIESHFAITPSTESKNSSPANGFTSVECGQLLCEELDSLAIIDTKNKHRSKESIACSDDLVPIHSCSTSIEDLKDKTDVHSKETSRSKESIACSDDLVKIEGPIESLEIEKNPANLLSPAEETISMFTQLSDKLSEIGAAEGDSGVDVHNLSDEETCRPEKWTILDLQFGIPLFEETLCERICRCIVERLAKPEVLEKIKEDNENICADVLKFVSQCQ
ncbi:Protein FAM91A1, partial [Eumeta japonica]